MSIHFSEMLVILLVALLVIKPERLPDTAAKLGRLIKWVQQLVAKIKNEVDVTTQPKAQDEIQNK